MAFRAHLPFSIRAPRRPCLDERRALSRGIAISRRQIAEGKGIPREWSQPTAAQLRNRFHPLDSVAQNIVQYSPSEEKTP